MGLNIRVKTTKGMVQNSRTRRMSEILTIKDHNIEVIMSFKYMETLINSTNNETEEIKARILATTKYHSSLQTVFRCKQIN